MAARRRRAPPEEWSCTLCTLLNHWRDRRCAACDQEREPRADGDDGSEDAAHEEAAAAQQTPSHEQHQEPTHTLASDTATAPVSALRCAPRGVFFSSAAAANAPATDWRDEPRLKVNRRKRLLPQAAASRQQSAVAFATTTTTSVASIARSSSSNNASAVHTNANAVEEAPSFSLLGGFGSFGALTSAAADVSSTINMAAPHMMHTNDAVSTQYQPVPPPPIDASAWARAPVAASGVSGSVLSDDEDPSQPCFQLLGPNTSMFLPVESTTTPAVAATTAAVASTTSDSEHARTFERDVELPPPPFGLIDVRSPPSPQRNASRRDHSSTNELHAQKSDAVSTAPTSNQQQGFVAASRGVPVVTDVLATDDRLAQAGLDLSDSDDELQRPPRHKLRRNRVATPEPEDDGDDCGYDEAEEKAPVPSGAAAATWECSICTNFNSPTLSRCELCDTKRDSDGNDSADVPQGSRLEQFIDLANSQEDAARAGDDAVPNYYGFDPGDFENPYEQVRPDSPGFDGYGGAYDDYVEDISDHEAPPPPPSSSTTFGQPARVRPDLREFEHFVCVEDLWNDYDCRIDYRQMFGDSKRGKSYADRVQSRKRASQKRKRAADAAGGYEPPPRATKKKGATKKAKGAAGRKAYAAAGGKARGAKKRKTAGGAKTAAATGAAAAASGSARGRRASAPSVYQGINHYDTSSVDFGDGVSTMAWEGVGSAGYS